MVAPGTSAGSTNNTAIASTSYTPISSSSSTSASMNRSTSQHSSALNSRTHSRQTSGQQQQHPHFFQHGHPSSSSSSSLFYPHNHSSGTSSSALSTPLGGSGILPSLSGYAGSIPPNVRTTSQREVVIPPAPHGCPAFLHRILLTHDAAYRRRIFEGLAYNHQPQPQPPPWQNEESDADSTLSHRRTETPASSVMSASTTTTMSGSTSTLGGVIPPRTPSQFPQPNIPTSLPFLEPLIPPENFAMINSKVYRSSLPLKKHFPFLKTLNLRSVLTLILEEYPASNTTFLDENGIQFFQFGIPGNKEPFVQIPEDMISNALIAILDVRNHPMLIHCNKGKHRTGCLVGCLRKLQQWSLTTIFDEYRKFSAPKSRSMDQEFVELYAGEEAVWTRVEPRWVPRWAGLPRGRVISHEDDDDDDEEGEGEGEAGGYSLDEEGEEEEEYDDEEELDLNLSERGRRRRRASFYSAMEVH